MFYCKFVLFTTLLILVQEPDVYGQLAQEPGVYDQSMFISEDPLDLFAEQTPSVLLDPEEPLAAIEEEFTGTAFTPEAETLSVTEEELAETVSASEAEVSATDAKDATAEASATVEEIKDPVPEAEVFSDEIWKCQEGWKGMLFFERKDHQMSLVSQSDQRPDCCSNQCWWSEIVRTNSSLTDEWTDAVCGFRWMICLNNVVHIFLCCW